MTEANAEFGTELWRPSEARKAQANLSEFAQRFYPELPDFDYEALWRASVAEPERFWQALWRYCDVIGDAQFKPTLVLGHHMSEARWFPNAAINYAENLLRQRPRSDEVLVFRAEDKLESRMNYGELCAAVSRLAQALRAQGVTAGDRIAAVLPNCPQALIAMLACASIGAIWSSCSPDFGVAGIVDRFEQIKPAILFLVDGYFYNGKWQDLSASHQQLREQLPSAQTIVVAQLGADKMQGPGISWDDFILGFMEQPLHFEALSFSHPLFILYSSGTTSKPKCIVHSHGGTLLQHLKEHQLHADIKPGEKLFYFSTCGWMMWNWLPSALASGAILMLYDGSPFASKMQVLFDYIDAEAIHHFGTSAKFIDACAKAGLQPKQSHKLESLRSILSTGSVLVPASFDYVYQAIKSDVCLASISGGTDIISCFALGNPWSPVCRGELQGRGLAMDVAVYRDVDGFGNAESSAGSTRSGQSVINEKGELVCRQPFPSQPIGFWQDPSGDKYRAAYFERFDNVWSQGDYVELTDRGTMIFYGRSDAVLNPGGVRIGTAEIYRQVESMPEIAESLAIGQAWDNDIRIVLFVRLQPGINFSADLEKAIKQRIRRNASPRHVPAKIVPVADIPRTRSGKIAELAVKQVVHNQAINNIEALANPEALTLFKDLPSLQS